MLRNPTHPRARIRALRRPVAATGYIATAIAALTFAWVPGTAAAIDDFAARVLDLTSQQRQQADIAPVMLSPKSDQAAQSYAGALAASNCLAHTCGPAPAFTPRD